ncbi:MAG TPA: hypothetical protein VE269_03810, partial [Gaiellaceae bacterium]|nr:hypothetical protein [Gaiellaceae bacterium]
GEWPSDEPVLIERGGGGAATRYDQAYWLWPLPPPGTLGFVAEWPSEGIPLTRVEVDAKTILDASARATVLWEPMGGGRGGVRSSTQYAVASELQTDDELST